MTGQEFKELQAGDVLLEYASMRHWVVLGNTSGVVSIQTTRLLPNSNGIELDGWSKVSRELPEPPPF
jgi:hypothetical protein